MGVRVWKEPRARGGAPPHPPRPRDPDRDPDPDPDPEEFRVLEIMSLWFEGYGFRFRVEGQRLRI